MLAFYCKFLRECAWGIQVSMFVWLALRKDTSGDNSIEHVLAKIAIEGVCISVYISKDIIIVYKKKCQLFVRLWEKMCCQGEESLMWNKWNGKYL